MVQTERLFPDKFLYGLTVHGPETTCREIGFSETGFGWTSLTESTYSIAMASKDMHETSLNETSLKLARFS